VLLRMQWTSGAAGAGSGAFGSAVSVNMWPPRPQSLYGSPGDGFGQSRSGALHASPQFAHHAGRHGQYAECTSWPPVSLFENMMW
jgi:hypothetical protein